MCVWLTLSRVSPEIGKDLFEKSKSLIAQIEQLERENRTLADQVAVFKSVRISSRPLCSCSRGALVRVPRSWT